MAAGARLCVCRAWTAAAHHRYVHDGQPAWSCQVLKRRRDQPVRHRRAKPNSRLWLRHLQPQFTSRHAASGTLAARHSPAAGALSARRASLTCCRCAQCSPPDAVHTAGALSARRLLLYCTYACVWLGPEFEAFDYCEQLRIGQSRRHPREHDDHVHHDGHLVQHHQ